MAKAAKLQRRHLRHLAFYLGATTGMVVGGAATVLVPHLALNLGAMAFFAAYFAMTLTQLPKLNAAFLRAHAAEEDAPAGVIFLVMIGVVVLSVVWLLLALVGGSRFDALTLGLGAVSVLLGWFSVHTMWAMHYAFEYYDVPDDEPGGSGEVVGGLAFPGGEDPDGTAFLYFAYVIGMTAQTSDTAVTTNRMRRIVIGHSVFSFFFNTIIVAAAVNLVVSLGR
ncbi:MAG: DUF1345 domain-containing protein [Devosia sp.]